MNADRAKKIDEFARIMWAVFLAFWFAVWGVYLIFNPGCSDAAKRDIKNFFVNTGKCAGYAALGNLAPAQAQLLKDINSAISGGVSFTSSEWKQTGISLAQTYGAELVACLVSSLFNELNNKPDSSTFKPGMKALSVSNKQDYEGYLKVVFDATTGK